MHNNLFMHNKRSDIYAVGGGRGDCACVYSLEEVVASPAYARWRQEYEPALERWFALMSFEEAWETADVLGSE